MSAFKNIDISSTVIKQNVVSYTHNFTTSSAGIQSINIISGSVSSSYWNSLNVLFYSSGSPQYPKEHKFEKPINNLAISDRGATLYLIKFHGYISGSIVSISQQYFGDKIKPESFELTDPNYKDNSGISLKIKDDGNGNLYSSNAHHSQSAATSISSSDNYVGNIYYDTGLAIITETGSWSGSVNYSDVTSQGDYEVQFKSTHTIFTREYSIEINPKEFNHSTNYTLRGFLSGSGKSLPTDSGSLLSNPYLYADFTGSEFQPYITTIGLYTKDNIYEPVIVARLPKPLRVSDKVTTTIKLRLDM